MNFNEILPVLFELLENSNGFFTVIVRSIDFTDKYDIINIEKHALHFWSIR